MNRPVRLALAAAASLLGAPARADVQPLSVAAIDFDYLDTSGEPTAQSARHVERMAEFMRALRADLALAGGLRVVTIACASAPGAAGDTPPIDLIARARKAGARLMLYGQAPR